MDEILLLDAIERYLGGSMNDGEKDQFEALRNNSPEIDQMVVEHKMFLHQLENHGQTRDMKHNLREIHSNLMENGEIKEIPIKPTGKVLQIWNKYRRVTAIAATIAGVTALFISGLVTYFTPIPNKRDLQYLSSQVEQIKRTQHAQSNQINDIKTKVPEYETPSNGGTSFLIDTKGFLITNAHVVRGASTILVQNSKGQEFKSQIVYIDEEKDLAILKIADEDFRPYASLPYSIRKSNTDLGEHIFTLGFPRDEIVYNEGYLSAKTGYNGDTLSFQMAVSANPGNSGGPVLNNNGEVIGVLSSSETTAEGVVFAIKSKNIFRAVEGLKKDTSYQKLKLQSTSSIKGIARTQQIKQIQDCVFMVKGFSK